MYRKSIWVPFLLILLSVMGWFIVKASYDLHTYLQWKVRSDMVVDQWEVQEIKSDQFVVIAHYGYTYKGKNYTGTGQVGGIYPNPWAAGEAKNRFSKQKWQVWLNPSHPEKNIVEKHFPIKRTLSAIVLIGLVLYFLALAGYMRFKH